MTKQTLIKSVLSLFVSFVFIQSLFFKFTGSTETDHIFGTLNTWAAGLGHDGLFVPPGIFNAYVIGTGELMASLMLLAGLFLTRYLLTALGALLGLCIMTGAIFFHLFTPLGIEVLGDGGTLFGMAVGVWVSCAFLVYTHKDTLCSLICRKN